ncbi:MAG: NADPH-dependent FMN reductase [Myxococcota bacterium]
MARMIGISGSVRTGSYNSSLLREAARLSPENLSIEIASIREIPLYDGDVDAASGPPVPVRELKDRIAAADGIILATPEYNNSMPGVLKNAVDWLTRPPGDVGRVFKGKIAAIMGATPGKGGTRFSQAAWLPVFHTLGLVVFSSKKAYVAGAGGVFDEHGGLSDDATKKVLGSYLAELASFVEAHRRA